MNLKQLKIMNSKPGFIAALDQSGGSTPKALKAYGIEQDAYDNEEEMFDLVHQMRTRIIESPAFTADRILAAILFEKTMDRKIDGMYTADYLWEEKGVVPILKIDKGLAEENNNVKLMKPIDNLGVTLAHAAYDRHIFGTKERSVIYDFNKQGIEEVIAQQFDLALKVASYGLVPIIEPEVDINNPHKDESEKYMLQCIKNHLSQISEDAKLMFKVTIPTTANLYAELINDKHVVRVVALSGGYSRQKADELLMENKGLIASFSRALLENLNYKQSEEQFDQTLKNSVEEIYQASVN